jgi:hypothetical protein
MLLRFRNFWYTFGVLVYGFAMANMGAMVGKSTANNQTI